jgi:peptide/nickel transport system substrate-binding protein
VGYLPTVDAPVPPAGASVGANPPALSDYQLSAYYPWELTYFPYNFNNPAKGPIFKQLYFREAFQSLVDQEGVVAGPLHGYGQPNIGPVSAYPVTKYLSPSLKATGDQWTLNIGRAETLLRGHGWNVVPNGKDTCIRPGSGPTECGQNIPLGTQLTFSLSYASGIDYIQESMRELASNASLAGIQVQATAEPFGTVVQDAFGGPAAASTWQLADWGAWTYSPDFLPTGEELFLGGQPNNAGDYNNAENNALITDTLDARTPTQFTKAMDTWESFWAKQLPVVLEPNTPQLVETVKGLDIGPQNSALTIMPELWHYGQ